MIKAKKIDEIIIKNLIIFEIFLEELFANQLRKI
tara:strand:+ start:1631 stop:1732 length:102 start_codon:yes stop_codon:yes gene_type:complete